MEYVLEFKIKKQAYKFFLLPFIWTLYLFLIPFLFSLISYLTFIFIIFPGLFLFTWMGYLMHETWHKYVPGLPNKFLYNIFAVMLLTDPQIYHMVHGSHHAFVNSYKDMEFHPLGKINNRSGRIIYNIFEIIFGIAFLSAIASFVIPFHPDYKKRFNRIKQIIAIAGCCAYFGGIGFLSSVVFNVNGYIIALLYVSIIYYGSFLLHQSQLVEHGNLIVDGDLKTRNIKTRNLTNKGIFEKIFLFFTHWDSQEHVLHHTLVRYYLRPFKGIAPIPEDAVFIDLKKYFHILIDMITGKERSEF